MIKVFRMTPSYMCVCVCVVVCVCVYSYISILQLKFELIVSLFSRTRISLPVLSSIFHFFLSPFLFTPTISLSRTYVMSVYVARCLLLLRRRNSLSRPAPSFPFNGRRLATGSQGVHRDPPITSPSPSFSHCERSEKQVAF